MKDLLNFQGLKEKAVWEKAKVALPAFDPEAVQKKTREAPVWLHFGGGNIFRGYIAYLQHRLLDMGEADRGIVVAETFDFAVEEQIYRPHDNMALLVTLYADGHEDRSLVASVADCYTSREMDALRKIAAQPSLQMMSFTVTEKGYSLYDMQGNISKMAQADMEAGPDAPKLLVPVAASLLLARYDAGGEPIALVSMDNCSHNGELLQNAVLEIARAWLNRGFVEEGFLRYVQEKVAFPWSMIDKITPSPAKSVKERLDADGIEGLDIVVTDKGTAIAPFVNAEAPQYLVIEDSFPNGRPALEKVGVYFTDRQTVNDAERMKVTTCLNPLHTAMAPFGCLLNFPTIYSEMGDKHILALVKRLGYDEGLPVVKDPGIFSAKDFLDEVVTERLPNPNIPDKSERIVVDHSQKVAIRFGETIKAYMRTEGRSTDSLIAIPLAIAAWLRYLLGLDDDLRPMQISDDPLVPELQSMLTGVVIGDPASVGDRLRPILSNKTIFGVDLYEAGLGERVEGYFGRMITGVGAVRDTLDATFPG